MPGDVCDTRQKMNCMQMNSLLNLGQHPTGLITIHFGQHTLHMLTILQEEQNTHHIAISASAMFSGGLHE